MSKEMSWAARAIIRTADGTVPGPRQRRRSLYDLAKNLILWIFWAQNIRMSITGADNIPLSGGVLLTPNHRAYYDVIPVSGPLQLRGDRKPRYMLKKEAFATRWIAKLFVELVASRWTAPRVRGPTRIQRRWTRWDTVRSSHCSPRGRSATTGRSVS